MPHNDAVYVAPSRLDGKGLFAAYAMGEGRRVVEYSGVKVPTPVADTLTTRFLFDLENGWTIDGESEDNIARYVNHSCTPNCEARIEGERIFFYSLRDVAPREEITIDYGKEYFDEFIAPIGCGCNRCLQKQIPPYMEELHT